MDRQLPSRRNPFIGDDETPPLEDLIAQRRLGRTNIYTSTPIKLLNEFKHYSIEILDYVHLRVPLPPNLVGSGIFLSSPTNHAPESYFLMRRCRDGFISATGLFKAAHPWASRTEENSEKDHLRKQPGINVEEIAGNAWVPPLIALELANTYGFSSKWVAALLDNSPVSHSISASSERPIAQPPKFEMPPKSTSQAKASARPRKRTVSRDIDSTSPAKDDASAPAKKPRKPRAKKNKSKEKDIPAEVPASASSSSSSSSSSSPSSSSSAANTSEGAAAVIEAVTADEAAALIATAEAEAEAEPLPEDTVRMSITSDKLPGEGDTEITRTTLKLELPANSPDLELPKDTEGVVEAAREMIESAKDLQEGTIDTSSALPATNGSTKRKADDLDEPSPSWPEEIIQEVAEGDIADLATGDGEIEMRPAKRTRVMVAAEEYRREKVKRRALVGISSALAVGVMVPFLSNLF